MIRKRIQRVNSRAALVSKALGICAALAFAVLVLLHKNGTLETSRFVVGLAAVALVTIAGIIAAFLGIRSLWKEGKVGGRRSLTGLALCLAVLSPFMFAAYKSATLPRLSDISTDQADPPMFNGESAHRLSAEVQSEAYPQVTGRRYELSAELVAAAIEEIVAAEGWKVLDRSGNLASAKEFQIEAEAISPIFGFKDFVAIRVTDEGRSAFVDMRSKSGFGSADLGANAARIAEFLDALDERATKEAGSQVKP